MASDAESLDTTFRCAVCHNRTGFEDARVLHGIWTCSRCANRFSRKAAASDRMCQDDWLEAAYEDRTGLADE